MYVLYMETYLHAKTHVRWSIGCGRRGCDGHNDGKLGNIQGFFQRIKKNVFKWIIQHSQIIPKLMFSTPAAAVPLTVWRFVRKFRLNQSIYPKLFHIPNMYFISKVEVSKTLWFCKRGSIWNHSEVHHKSDPWFIQLRGRPELSTFSLMR